MFLFLNIMASAVAYKAGKALYDTIREPGYKFEAQGKIIFSL